MGRARRDFVQKPEAHGAVFISCTRLSVQYCMHSATRNQMALSTGRGKNCIAPSSGAAFKLLATPLPHSSAVVSISFTARSQSQEWGAAAWPAARPPVQPQAAPAGEQDAGRSNKPGRKRSTWLWEKEVVQTPAAHATAAEEYFTLNSPTPPPPHPSTHGAPRGRRSAGRRVARMDSLALTLRSCGPEMAALKRS